MQSFTVLASIALALASSALGEFTGGNCGVHITQWQKNENGVGGDYQYDVRLYDAVQVAEGGANRLAVADFACGGVDSALPLVFEVCSGSVDSDPITFHYGGDTFDSHSCSVGGYDSGKRQMDCGFAC